MVVDISTLSGIVATLCQQARTARINRVKSEQLATRVRLLLDDLVAVRQVGDSQALVTSLETLEILVNEAIALIAKFQDTAWHDWYDWRGWYDQYFNASNWETELATLNQRLTECIESLNLAIGTQSIRDTRRLISMSDEIRQNQTAQDTAAVAQPPQPPATTKVIVADGTGTTIGKVELDVADRVVVGEQEAPNSIQSCTGAQSASDQRNHEVKVATGGARIGYAKVGVFGSQYIQGRTGGFFNEQQGHPEGDDHKQDAPPRPSPGQ